MKQLFSDSIKILIFFLFIISAIGQIPQAFGANLMGRLGVGMTNQVASNMDAISFKVQRSRSMAFGGFFGFQSNKDNTSYAAGGKLYRILYDEPQLTFYTAGLLAFFSYPNLEGTKSDTGNQIELLMGTEFSFQGLESIGFSFEFGGGYINYQGENSLAITNHNLLRSAVHFYF
jgi:hypothetical protein